MKYIDSGSRDGSQTLADWLTEQLGPDVSHFRVQSGFFGKGSLGLLEDTLTNEDIETAIVIGANQGTTTRKDVETLFELMKMPRPNARLGIVSYESGFYHPKVYHIRRSDGSQCAYVGSSNLTLAGLSTHVEAGLTLDTSEEDDQDLLEEIISATEEWFTEDRAGFHSVENIDSIDTLESKGILSDSKERTAEQVEQSRNENSEEGDSLHRLRTLPSPSSAQESTTSAESESSSTDANAEAEDEENVVAPHDDFPDHLLFKPGAEPGSTTVGRNALTGAGIPSEASGLIVKLNKDAARYFPGGSGTGTANISVGTDVSRVFRFGIYHRKPRPAASFRLHMQFLLHDSDTSITLTSDERNLYAVGYLPDEDSHPDIRLSLPTVPLRDELMSVADEYGVQAPTEGNYVFLEFPSSDDPSFRLTFLEPSSALHQEAEHRFENASQDDKPHTGACWLPEDMSPEWEG